MAPWQGLKGAPAAGPAPSRPARRPPRRLATWVSPFFCSCCVARAERLPEWQSTTVGRSVGISSARVGNSGRGISRLPGMRPSGPRGGGPPSRPPLPSHRQRACRSAGWPAGPRRSCWGGGGAGSPWSPRNRDHRLWGVSPHPAADQPAASGGLQPAGPAGRRPGTSRPDRSAPAHCRCRCWPPPPRGTGRTAPSPQPRPKITAPGTVPASIGFTSWEKGSPSSSTTRAVTMATAMNCGRRCSPRRAGCRSSAADPPAPGATSPPP